MLFYPIAIIFYIWMASALWQVVDFEFEFTYLQKYKPIICLLWPLTLALFMIFILIGIFVALFCCPIINFVKDIWKLIKGETNDDT